MTDYAFVPKNGLRVPPGTRMVVPTGTTAQRPSVPVVGDWRFNTDFQAFEGFYANGSWGALAVFGGNPTDGTFSNSVAVGATTPGPGSVFVNSTSIQVGNTLSISPLTISVGNSTINATMNSTTLQVGPNMVVNTTFLGVGNSSVNVLVNATSIAVGPHLITATSDNFGNSTFYSNTTPQFMQVVTPSSNAALLPSGLSINGGNTVVNSSGIFISSLPVYFNRSGGTLSGSLNYNAPVVIAASTTPAIGGANSNIIHMTGVATITGFDNFPAGAERKITHFAAQVLTYNSSTMIMPGLKNIITSANDVSVWRSLGAGAWQMISYQRASGAALVADTRNYVVNPAMMVSQENGSAAGNNVAGYYYPVDCFGHAFTHSGGISVKQVTKTTPGGSPNRIRLTVTAPDTNITAAKYAQITTCIEGSSITDLKLGASNAKSMVVQFGVSAPAGTYCVSVFNFDNTRSYTAEITIAAGEANTDVVKSFVMPPENSGNWAKDSTAGLFLRFGLAWGSNYWGTPNAWASSGIASAGTSNQFNFMGTNGNVFELFDVGLYEGVVAPSFSVPDYGKEFAACSRFLEYVTVASGQVNSPNLGMLAVRFGRKRVLPSFYLITSGTVYTGGATSAISSLSAANTPTQTEVELDVNMSNALPAGNALVWRGGSVRVDARFF
jgi:hypothetical protein